MKKLLALTMLLTFMVSASAKDIITGEYFYIQSAQAEKSMKGFWDLPGFNPKYEKGAQLKVYTLETRVNDRLFKFEDAGDGWYYIIPKNAERRGRIDVSGNKKGNGVKIQVWEENDSDAQKFKLKHLGQGEFKIYTKHGDILALAGKSHKDGSVVHTWEDHEGPFTEWIFIMESDLKKNKYYPEYDFATEPKFFKVRENTNFYVKSQNAHTSGSKGTARVASIDDNKVTLELTTTGINPMNGKEETSTYNIEIRVENGKYVKGNDPEYQESGMPEGNTLELNGPMSAFTIFRF